MAVVSGIWRSSLVNIGWLGNGNGNRCSPRKQPRRSKMFRSASDVLSSFMPHCEIVLKRIIHPGKFTP